MKNYLLFWYTNTNKYITYYTLKPTHSFSHRLLQEEFNDFFNELAEVGFYEVLCTIWILIDVSAIAYYSHSCCLGYQVDLLIYHLLDVHYLVTIINPPVLPLYTTSIAVHWKSKYVVITLFLVHLR